MSFAQWVKDTRGRQQLSIVECAARAGVSHPAWIEYENTTKQKQPRKETVLKIAGALNITESVALEAAGFSSAPAKVSAEIESVLKQIPQDRMSGAVNILRAYMESCHPQQKLLHRPVGIVSGFKPKTR